MSRLVAFLVLFLLIWMVFQRLRAMLLTSPRGAELRAIWRLLRQAAGSGEGPRAPGPGRDPSESGRNGATPPILLVRCSVCGTHVPEAKARRGTDGAYRCEACQPRQAR